tara:strand:+ start:221 stop:502 length:282 start_codon:yes stop_codon:yes gene_type:complete
MIRIVENNPHSQKIIDNTSIEYQVLQYLEGQPETFFVPVTVIINNLYGQVVRSSVSAALKKLLTKGKIEKEGRGIAGKYRITPKWRGQTLRHN